MAVEFTPYQLAAIECKRVDACVVAGPGSGKTTVLVERYRELIEYHGLEPRQLLAITFTEKAAANMKAKLAEKFRHDKLRLRDLESAYVSTIHGFCARLLRENAIAAGIDPRFSVLDARESDDLQTESMNAALDELTAGRREDALELIETLQSPRSIAWDLKNAYDAIRSAGKPINQIRAMPSPVANVTPAALAIRLVQLVGNWLSQLSLVQREQRADLIAWAPELADVDSENLESLRLFVKRCPINLRRVPERERPALEALRDDLQVLITQALDVRTAHLRQIVFDVLLRFEALYCERKTSMGALDFNDLERRCIEMLRRDATVQDRVRKQFLQVMLDEFQDINEQQEELIRMIRGDDVFFAVGDVNQSIYGFRHAQPGIFKEYRRVIEEAGKHSAHLIDNFRSRAGILRCVEALLNSEEGIEPRNLVAGAEFEEATEPCIEVLRISGEDSEEAAQREARWIAHRILGIGRDFRDFAVLCRNGDSMKPILEKFDRLRIPYVCGRRESFLVSREGLDITALLQIVANPRDSISLATVLRSALVGIGDEALLRMKLLSGSLTSGLNTVAYDTGKLERFSDEDAQKLMRFAAGLKRWRADLDIIPLDVLLGRMLADCGFEWNENVEAFLHLARTKGAERSLLHFLHELESIEGAVDAESDLSDTDQGNCVQVMTAHAAKGLEFPVTIIAALGDGTRRSSAPVTFTPEHGLGIKWKDPLTDDGLKDSWALANAERLKQREKEEANRLLYVAMTRAEGRLILSYSCARQRPANWAKMVEEFFGLAKRPPSTDARTVALDGFDASVLVTDADPPEPGVLERRPPPEIVVLPRPALGDRRDTAINVTSLAVFADCPRKYYIQRYIGWNNGRFAPFSPHDPTEDPPEDDGEVSAAELGSAVHEALAGKPGDHGEEALELARVFTGSALGRRAASSANSAREWEFIADIEGTLVRGSIDLWFEENGEFYIVDYKTDDVKSAGVPERAAGYAPQLALYALAMERAFGKRPARAYLHFLRPDAVSELRVEDKLLDDARALIAGLRESQHSLGFDLREGLHCRSCPFYKSLCPAGYGGESVPPPEAATSPQIDSGLR